MKKLAILVFSLLFALSINAQWGEKRIKGNGHTVTKERKTADYDEINVAGFFNVELVSGNEGNIIVKAEENLLEYIITEVKGNQLFIKTKNGYSINTSIGNKILITVPFKDIHQVILSGSGDVNSKNIIKTTNFKTSVSGSGNVNLKIDATNVEATVTGSGNLRLNGNSNDFQCHVTGSGDIHAYKLKSEDVDASVTGSGDIKLYCSGVLKANIVGSGDIQYQGSPTKEFSKTVGSGDISKG